MMITLVADGDAGHVTNSVLDQRLARSVMIALSDDFSRRIVSSVIAEGKTVQQISSEKSIPLSTCYRRSKELVKEGVLYVERIVLSGEGKRYAVYRSSLKSVDVSSNFLSLTVKAEILEDAAEKLRLKRVTHGLTPEKNLDGALCN